MLDRFMHNSSTWSLELFVLKTVVGDWVLFPFFIFQRSQWCSEKSPSISLFSRAVDYEKEALTRDLVWECYSSTGEVPECVGKEEFPEKYRPD